MATKVLVKTIARPGTNPVNYFYAVSKSKDAASVTKWYEYNQRMPIDEGIVYFFTKSKLDNRVHVKGYRVDCNGGSALCELSFQSFTKKANIPFCQMAFSSFVKVGGNAVCSMSFQSFTKIS